MSVLLPTKDIQMVEEIERSKIFSKLPRGQDTADIGRTGASLLTLPLLQQPKSQIKQLVASAAPNDSYLDNVEEFWRELVLNQDVSLVVNLVDEIGSWECP